MSLYAGDSISTAGNAPPGSLPNPGVAVCEKREFWEILFAAVAEEMASGTSIEDVPDSLLASTEFRTMFLDRMDPYAWEESEMWILLRRVAIFTATGR